MLNQAGTQWRQAKWGDLITLEYGKGLRDYNSGAGQYVVYGTNGPIGRYKEPLCKHEGVIIGRKGAYRGVHYSPEPFYVIDTAFYVEPKQDMNMRWAYYAMLTHDINGMDSGSAIPSTSRPDFYNLPVLLPPLPKQRAIAAVLGALDDKIELNQRMNETLEAIARAIFKAWFVDFEPTRAKAEGRQPFGMDAATAALFPASFQPSALGDVPEGWRVGRLDDLLVLQRGYDLPATQRITGSFPVVAASGPSGTHNEWRVKGPGITTGRSGVLGKVFLVLDDYWPLNTSLFVKEFIVSKPAHAYYLLQSLNFSSFNAGSAVPTLNRNHVHNLQVVVPSMDAINSFEDTTMKLFRLGQKNDQQSRTLAELRDTLLPKLISGAVRVREAERLVAEAV